MADDTPVSYEAAVTGSPVRTSSGREIGTLEHVLQVPELDLFDGLVIATADGLRFVDADQVARITRSTIVCDLSEEQVRNLPAPSGTAIYHADALADSGPSLHDKYGRLFGRPHWIREHD